MRTKSVLIVSLGANAVLLSAMAYIQTLSIEPKSTPPIIYLINQSQPETVEAAMRAAAIVEQLP